MPEVAGQMQQGREMSERECLREGVGHIRKLREAFQAMAQRYATARTPLDCMIHLHGFRDCFRGIAALRMDMRWLLPARIAEQMEDQLQAEFKVAGQGGVALVYRTERWNHRVKLLEKLEHQVTRLFDRAAPPLLILPRSEGH
jgi:hypothetical protein